MGIPRKLQDVRRDLAPLEQQGKAAGFFNNFENAGTLGSLVEDIRDAMVEYQVCVLNHSSPSRLTFVLDLIATRSLRQEFPTHRESHPLPFVFAD